jgi:cation diffusion facilitator family transporter
MHGSHKHEHGPDGHTHGLTDKSILRSKEGVQAVSWSLAVLLTTAVVQAYILSLTSSISLLADVIHNFGDALTAIPLAAAFLLRNRTAEKYAGFLVVAVIFVSAGITAFEAFKRLAHPQSLEHLYILIAAGIIGFIGNEIAAFIRLRAGKHLHSPALIADGDHARVDGIVSLSVIVSAMLVASGFQIADPIIGLLVTFAILHITWQSYKTIKDAV